MIARLSVLTLLLAGCLPDMPDYTPGHRFVVLQEHRPHTLGDMAAIPTRFHWGTYTRADGTSATGWISALLLSDDRKRDERQSEVSVGAGSVFTAGTARYEVISVRWGYVILPGSVKIRLL